MNFLRTNETKSIWKIFREVAMIIEQKIIGKPAEDVD